MIRVVTDEAGFWALRPAWPTARPFQSWAWLSAWWRQFGNARPVVSVLEDRGAIVGALALYRFAEDGRERLLPMGVGVSDYADAALRPGSPDGVCGALLRAALEACDVSCAEIPEVPPDAALRTSHECPGWASRWDQGAPCPVLALADAFEDAVPSAARRKWRMNVNRCTRIGAVQIVTNADFVGDVALLARFNAARRQDSVLTDARVRAMLADALDGMDAALSVLRLGGVPAAAILAFTEPDRVNFYLSGFAEAFAAASPGSVLLGTLLQAAQARGVREAHFLRGDEAYKMAWGAVPRRNATLVMDRT